MMDLKKKLSTIITLFFVNPILNQVLDSLIESSINDAIGQIPAQYVFKPSLIILLNLVSILWAFRD